ncbi:Cmr1p [Sporobolomyces salmoneus]|uniref:Cmr1p n=1 Tax=Sporobolomyces salmoneus TaxID=183962 RepID=UPI003177BDC9
MAFDFANFRAGNIASNAELANTTGLTQATSSISKGSNASTPRKTPSGKKIGRPKGSGTGSGGAQKRKLQEDFVPRKSTRTRAAAATTLEEKALIHEQNEKEDEERRRQEREEKHLPREMIVSTGLNGASDQESFKEMIRGLAEFELTKKEKEEQEEEGWKLGERPDYDQAKLEKITESLELRSIIKVVPERIYSLAVHPDTTKDLVFAGDKYGNIALWDATNAGQSSQPSTTEPTSIRDGVKKEVKDEDDGEEGAGVNEEATEEQGEGGGEEPSNGKFWLWKAHSKSSVSCLKFRPHETKKIYSSCYDKSLRSHDFETGTSEDVIDADDEEYDGLLHSFDFDPSGNEIWATDGAGRLHWRDLRTPIAESKFWNIDKAKVGCISINPARPTLAATAHLKREMRIWDLSKLRGLDTELDHTQVVEQAMVVAYPYEKACSSSYFDPSGTRLLSTGYDDLLRVWNIDPFQLEKQLEVDPTFEPAEIIPHNCQVGRFVTVLRAFWSPLAPSIAPPHIHVGDMRRALDLYLPDGTMVKSFSDEAITAVPAVTACHPTLPGKYYGGSASGKIAYFAQPLV